VAKVAVFVRCDFYTFAKNFRLKKILIIRFSSIGDIVLTTPVVRCLKTQHPDFEIHFLTKVAFAPLLSANPYISKVISIKNSTSEVTESLKLEKYDYIIDLHKNIRSLGIRWKLRVKTSSFPKLNVRKWLLVQFKINLMPKIHIVDRYFKAVKSLDVSNDNKGLDYFFSDSEKISSDQLPSSHRNGYVAMVIGGKHKTKQLPVEKAVSILKKINYPVILLGGKEDAEEGNLIQQQAGKHVYSACGKFTINQSAFLINQSLVVITNDTGLMHIAAALHKPIISIWGNTTPELGMYPYMPGYPELFKIFEVKGLPCRPCSKIGFEKCPKQHFKCMMNQDIDAIVQSTVDFMESKADKK